MQETRICTRCGNTNAADASFCATCGASLIAPATGATVHLTGSVCPGCGSENPSTAQFCSACGQQLAPQPVPRSQPYASPPESKRQGAAAMYCPVCREVTLVITDRQGIEIDYCPQCRGVWLDRGELDKIIERVGPSQGEASRYPNQPREYDNREYRERRDYDDRDDYRRKKKRGGLLGELFDFD